MVMNRNGELAIVDETGRERERYPIIYGAKIKVDNGKSVKSGDLKDLFVRFLDSTSPVVRSYGLRGIGANGFSDLKERVKKMSEQDPNPGTRQEAARSLAKL